ncbi:hypothetical protein [Tenacibaculum aiptasiae]|uniref:hypothetical protein n=1 Tax=Tenacibaculum aiptasiae TaxID=426481 RepID=UPI00232A8246|nr:hypothetical protein [Tenacibaculum aiptasiae]
MKNKLYFLVVFLVLISVVFSCEKKANVKKEVIANGVTKLGMYTFCGFMPTEVNYTYRTGRWVFLTHKKNKIAEGEYDIVFRKVDDIGGCEYEYVENKLDLNKWKFWNSKGELINPTKEIVAFIKSKKVKGVLYLE